MSLSHLVIFLSHLIISNIISGCLRRDWWFDTDHGAKLCWATKAFNKEGVSVYSVHRLRIGGQQRGDDVAQSDGATTVSVHFKLQAPLLKNPNNCPPSRYFSRISLRYYPCSISFPISFENNFTVGTLTHQETLFVCWAVCCLSVGWVYLLHCLELP